MRSCLKLFLLTQSGKGCRNKKDGVDEVIALKYILKVKGFIMTKGQINDSSILIRGKDSGTIIVKDKFTLNANGNLEDDLITKKFYKPDILYEIRKT